MPIVRYDASDAALVADERVAPPAGEPHRPRDRAGAFRHGLFAASATVPSAELFARAASAGLSERTVVRALGPAGVEPFKDGRRRAYRAAANAVNGLATTGP